MYVCPTMGFQSAYGPWLHFLAVNLLSERRSGLEECLWLQPCLLFPSTRFICLRLNFPFFSFFWWFLSLAEKVETTPLRDRMAIYQAAVSKQDVFTTPTRTVSILFLWPTRLVNPTRCHTLWILWMGNTKMLSVMCYELSWRFIFYFACPEWLAGDRATYLQHETKGECPPN